MGDTPEEADIDEMEWLRAAAANPVFDFLKEPKEDIRRKAEEPDRYIEMPAKVYA